LLHSAAEQYLHAEDNARHAQHRPRLRPPEQLTLDGSRDDE
jgi:hypothetical protein